jgi:hypothetical protein
MTALTCPSPANITPLIGSGNYVFSLAKFPEITFFVQEVELPEISLGVAVQYSSVHDVPIPGDTMEYGDLNCTFQIDSKMENYLALHRWMIGLGYPEKHDLYKELMNDPKNANSYLEISKGYTEGALTILDNAMKPIAQVTFVDCFPIRLSGIQFNSTNPDASPVTAQATFTYTYYKIATNS